MTKSQEDVTTTSHQCVSLTSPTNLDSELQEKIKSLDSGDFIKKLKNIDHVPQDALTVTADVIGLYPSIPHDAGLKALRKSLDNLENKMISTDDLTKMAEFVL